MKLRFQHAGSVVLTLALTGCGFHHRPKPVPVAQAQPPDLRQTPLYAPELGQNDPNPPALPGTLQAKAQPAPPAEPEPRRQKTPRKAKPAPAKATTEETQSAAKESPAPPSAPAQDAAQAPATTQQAVVTRPIEPETSGSPIGQITSGTSSEAVETKRETVDLIQSAEKGINDLKRSLSDEEKKALAQIKSFLQQAQKALENGDADGAHTLATKAKLMLDELSAGS